MCTSAGQAHGRAPRFHTSTLSACLSCRHAQTHYPLPAAALRLGLCERHTFTLSVGAPHRPGDCGQSPLYYRLYPTIHQHQHNARGRNDKPGVESCRCGALQLRTGAGSTLVCNLLVKVSGPQTLGFTRAFVWAHMCAYV